MAKTFRKRRASAGKTSLEIRRAHGREKRNSRLHRLLVGDYFARVYAGAFPFRLGRSIFPSARHFVHARVCDVARRCGNGCSRALLACVPRKEKRTSRSRRKRNKPCRAGKFFRAPNPSPLHADSEFLPAPRKKRGRGNARAYGGRAVAGEHLRREFSPAV